ncbi:MAG: hypothetical protein HFH14_08945 [Lachnospiraceae bacterium]|nr:hypothetical protein [Lachnospiraceae bacterium]
MSIRPIDIVTVAPKSQEASHLQANNLRGREHAEMNANHVFERNEIKNQQRTVELGKSDTQKYKLDAKDGNGKGYKGNSKKRKAKKEDGDIKKENKDNSYSGGFDIKI